MKKQKTQPEMPNGQTQSPATHAPILFFFSVTSITFPTRECLPPVLCPDTVVVVGRGVQSVSTERYQGKDTTGHTSAVQ